MMRLSPPSTGIRYTMSALESPVAGRSGTVLPIFTISTRCREFTGSPVKGENSWVGVGEGEGEGEGVAAGRMRTGAGPPLVASSTAVAVAPPATATPSADSQVLRVLHTITKHLFAARHIRAAAGDLLFMFTLMPGASQGIKTLP